MERGSEGVKGRREDCENVHTAKAVLHLYIDDEFSPTRACDVHPPTRARVCVRGTADRYTRYSECICMTNN